MENTKTKQQKPEESAGSLAAEPRGDGVSARVRAVGRPLGVFFFFGFSAAFVSCVSFHLVLKQTNKALYCNLRLSRT